LDDYNFNGGKDRKGCLGMNNNDVLWNRTRGSRNCFGRAALWAGLAALLLVLGGCPNPTDDETTYTITFDSNGGSDVAAITRDEGTQVDKPDNPTKDGYDFTGWFDAASGGTAYTWPHTLVANVTMHAQWDDDSKAQYTITFESHGGSEVAEIKADKGASVPQSAVADPKWTGHTFLGWFSAAAGGTAYTWPHTLVANVTMHAQWHDDSKAQFTITFDSHGGSEVAEIKADEGASVPQSAVADPKWAGHTFLGWFSAAAGGTAYTWPHTLVANVTMHAQWQDDGKTKYTITFDSHGGSDVAAITRDAGSSVAQPKPDPTKDGYDFTGWFPAASGGTAYDWPHTLVGDVTMHAQWHEDSKAQYTITFDSNGGSDVAAITKDVGTKVDKPDNPTKDGYDFTGWFNAASGGAQYTVWPHELKASVTMHAQWSVNEVEMKITIKDVDGTITVTGIPDGGISLSKSGDPATVTLTVEGFTSPVWYVDGSGTKTEAKSITLTASAYGKGDHSVSFTGFKDGMYFSKEISFTVAE
jgi:uncharacterized repeat protein (TIGR02543 family)